MYLLQLGFLDGPHGAVLCGLAAAQVLLKYAELWARPIAREVEGEGPEGGGEPAEQPIAGGLETTGPAGGRERADEDGGR
jgi:hypothetical protein